MKACELAIYAEHKGINWSSNVGTVCGTGCHLELSVGYQETRRKVLCVIMLYDVVIMFPAVTVLFFVCKRAWSGAKRESKARTNRGVEEAVGYREGMEKGGEMEKWVPQTDEGGQRGG